LKVKDQGVTCKSADNENPKKRRGGLETSRVPRGRSMEVIPGTLPIKGRVWVEGNAMSCNILKSVLPQWNKSVKKRPKPQNAKSKRETKQRSEKEEKKGDARMRRKKKKSDCFGPFFYPIGWSDENCRQRHH